MFRFNKKSYSLYSGERQTAADVSGIRADHTARYEFCAEFLKSLHCNNYLKGLDCFCGNGYGSAILADNLPDVTISSIDASEDAIAFARKFYHRDNVQYIEKCFPFKLESKYDFIVSKFVLFCLVVACAIILIITTLFQNEDSNNADVITGQQESYYSKNKGGSRDAKLKLITIITSIIAVVCVILYFASLLIYSGN